MKGYKTSRDYKKFRELLDNGAKIIVICGYDGCGFAEKMFAGYYCVNNFCKDVDVSDGKFSAWCTNHEVEFIEPNY